MKKIFLTLLLIILPFLTHANNDFNTGSINIDQYKINYNLDIEQEIIKQFKGVTSINTNYKIDLYSINEKLKILNPNKKYTFKWTIIGLSETTGETFQRVFNEKGEKQVKLEITETFQYQTGETLEEKTNKIYNKNFDILVFEKSLPLIYSDKLDKNDLKNYIEGAKREGIYIYEIGPLNKTDIELNSISSLLDGYEKSGGLKGDFITIWGDKDFLFDITSKINREIISNDKTSKIKYNIVSISGYNLKTLNNYLKNFLSSKNWINRIILINEESKYNIIKQNQIKDLIRELDVNSYDFIEVNLDNNQIKDILFLSKFINNLSNLGYSIDNIYIFIIIPIILSFIIIVKHFIGFSPIGLIIPLFMSILLFKLGILLGISLIFIFVLVNIILSFLIEKYNLLYAPKMTFILIINIILFILLLNIAYIYKIIPLSINDSIYFIIFILICEKFINIIISKDILEYKNPFIVSIIISLVSFFTLSIDNVKNIILAYPEIIILLIPLSFIIGKFSGLRVTEFFRFKEIIKNIEE